LKRKQLTKQKKIYFSAVVMVLSFYFLIPPAFAQSARMIGPVLSDDSLSGSLRLSQKQDKKFILIAQNTLPSAENEISAKTDPDEVDELDDDLLDDYQTDSKPQSISDPLYYLNYFMYSLNDFLYFAAIKPVATGYKFIVPTIVRKGVNNFFHNLLFPVRFINNILQGEMKDAGTEIEIFLINTTVGVLGFGQVAQNKFDLRTSNEDLGLTLGSYSIGHGFYLVLPILGPTTLRDTLGLAGDYFLTPVNYAEPWELLWGLKATDAVNSASLRLGDYEALKAASLDPYAALRNAYIQYREEKLKD
jgi:phospholipid-binding lipoprotein MlaA